MLRKRCFCLERMLSDEEKIRRAIEISQRRSQHYSLQRTAKVNVNQKKDYKLFKRMLLQILICLLIYCIFYLITTTNYIFSEDVIEKTSSILNYDINFHTLYEKGKKEIKSLLKLDGENQETTSLENTTQNELIENNMINGEGNTVNAVNAISQMEQDAITVKKLCDFEIPLKGTITSGFRRERSNIKCDVC